ncbi:het domain-containing [Fusarium albosuccineum]|uniref:Het domain-containing n=1 Tax=Fusarium albosuccineum TaxID=1237068 RepID=A0A8H4LJV3_9HYPO|nr:het domain-containing [Fusarium albosuccineum]
MPASTLTTIDVDFESPRLRDVHDTIGSRVSTNDFSAYWLRKRATPTGERVTQTKTLLWIHGGAYTQGNPFWMFSTLFRLSELMLDRHVNLDILSLDYTLAPEAVFPYQQKEAVAAYRYLVESEIISSENIIVGGESAGGHLAIACLLGIFRQGLPRPAMSILLCPWVNLANTGDSFERNKKHDFINKGQLDAAAELVVGPGAPHGADNLANFSLPYGRGWSWGEVLPSRTSVNVGSHDLLVDDIVFFFKNAKSEGANIELEITEAKTHGWQAMADYLDSDAYYKLQGEEEVPEGMLPGSISVMTGLLYLLENEGLDQGLEVDMSALKESAATCPTCALVWQAICAAVEEETSAPDVLFKSMLIENKPPKHPGPMIIHIYPDPVAYGVDEKMLQLYTTEDDNPAPWDLIGRGFHIPEYGLSPSCVALAREWLDMCVHAKEKHANCAKAGIPVLPSRVVLVGDDETAPRLVISEAGQQGHYAALSHCWGGITSIMTTTSNLEEYTDSLPADLPKTFLDAICVARALDIPYIWIDSLCIIQDSPEDWQHEASRMAQVYANAYVTIFADAAPNSTSGFLDSPSRQAPARFTVPYKTGLLGSGVINVRTRGFLAEELPFHSWTGNEYDSGRSKLSRRGWVFQERLLSPRTLHFSSNEMAWECSVMKHFLYPQDPDVPLIETNWRSDIVPAYTQLDLTFETDRLPAIEGLAKAANALRSTDQYIAGLWRNSIKDDLLWHVTRNGWPSFRIENGGVPTWSWASVTGAVIYNTRQVAEDDDLEVLDVVTNEGNTPVLLVRGHLVKVEVADATFGSSGMVLLGPDDELAVLWDVRSSAREFKHTYFLVFGADGNGPFGLLLAPELPGPTDKQFRRIGYISGYHVSKRRRSWGSGGWVSESTSVSEVSDDVWEEANQAGAMEWVEEIFQGEAKTFRIV